MNEKQGTRYVLEKYGSTHRRTFKIEPYEHRWEKREENLSSYSFTKHFMSAFLPHGFPESVSGDYLQYQIWDSIQAFASSITGSICTHAILKGSGVGDENATVIAATIAWLLKDGVSMAGRIVFAWCQGTRLDGDCKKWRLFADVLNDIAMFADLISAYFQSHFLFIVCISGLLKSLVGVAGGCTRAALTQHQARRNNMADVSAKDGSQETFVNLIALLCSLVMLPIVTNSMMLTWFLYVSMTIVHLSANYFAVKSVIMETFNEARFEIYATHFLKEGNAKRNFLSVSDVNQKETVLSFQWFEDIQIKMGSSFLNAIERRTAGEVEEFLNMYKDCHYLLRVQRSSSKTIIHITLNPKATTMTKLEAFYQACFIKYILHHPNMHKREKKSEKILEANSREYTTMTFADFKASLELMKYNTENVVFNDDLWRAEW